MLAAKPDDLRRRCRERERDDVAGGRGSGCPHFFTNGGTCKKGLYYLLGYAEYWKARGWGGRTGYVADLVFPATLYMYYYES